MFEARPNLYPDTLAFIDATGPLAGLPGPYRGDRAQKFWRGPHKPRLGDLADTELVVFGA